VRIGLLGGLTVEHDGRELPVSGAMQLAVLFRLAVDAGSSVSYRAIAEDVWSADAPENERAALQSIVSRLRSQLPAGSIESTAGGYRLAVARTDVDALLFCDLVAAAGAAPDGAERRRLASEALDLWSGEPWVPSDDFDWFERDLRRDRAAALELGGTASLRARESGIPAPLTGLVGRGDERRAIDEQLAASRLVTIVGVGGAGKTRLAVETAAGVHGSILVELAPAGPDEAMAAVLAATGRDLRTSEVPELLGTRDRIVEALVGRPVLLVLDNCEHLVEEAARIAESLLGGLPQLRILATSREPLGVPGEAFVSVGPLPHPSAADLDAADPAVLAAFDAVELFRQRAVAARSSDLDPAELLVAARIASRLDGLPLALELAAAKLRTMTPDEVLAGLEDRFSLLTGGFRTALPRHQTLRAMIDWSWSMLTEPERHALTWLAVFPAGVDARDAGRIGGALGVGGASVFDALVDRSLLQRSRGRFRALETIREYGIERLAEQGRLAEARRLQVEVMDAATVEHDRLLRGPRILEAIAWFDSEDDNIAAALRYAVSADLGEHAVRLALSCAWYWIVRDLNEDARGWFEAVSELAADVDTDEARVLTLVAPLARAFGGASGEEQQEPEAFISSKLAALPPEAFPVFTAESHDLLQLFTPMLAAFSSMAGRDSWAGTLRLPLGEELGLAPWPSAVLHVMRAAMAQNRGDVDDLGTESETAAEQFRAIGDIWGLAFALQMRAEWLTLEGRLDEAFAATEESTSKMRSITSSTDLAQQQGLAISIMLRQGRDDEARVRVAELLAEAEASGNARTTLQSLNTAMFAALQLGDLDEAEGYLARFDELASSWPMMPRQLVAWEETARAGVRLRRGELDAAEAALTIAVESSLASHDHPIIGLVALTVGSLALARGDLPEALRALDLSTAIIGAYDSTNPQVVEIERAALNAGVERAGALAPTRSTALEDLRKLVP
jgi:predicted ATPase/tetratricopeptide (TPR) repeat protein